MIRRRAPAQALVELAFILPVLLIMVLGMIEVGRGFVFGVATQDGARQAARLAANARQDPAISDRVIFQRLIDSSAPAMSGCTLPGTLGSVSTTLTCPAGAGTWQLSMVITPNGTASVANTFAGLSTAGLNQLNGATVEVKAVGSVSLLAGFATGAMGLSLYQLSVQGDAVMVVL